MQNYTSLPYSDNALAQRIAEQLAEADRKVSTPRLNTLVGGRSKEDHVRVRKVANRMVDRGTLARTGTGKFHYRWIGADTSNPYTPSTTDATDATDAKIWVKDLSVCPGLSIALAEGTDTYTADVRRQFNEYGRISSKQADVVLRRNKLEVPVHWRDSRTPVYAEGAEQSTERPAPHAVDVEKMRKANEQLAKQVDELKRERDEALAVAGKKPIKVQHSTGKTVELKDVILPKSFEEVLALCAARQNVLLVGPAGCGKTHMGSLVADALDLAFSSISCTSGMSEAHLLGRSVPNIATGESTYQLTEFVRCYEQGGVFLLDEMDAADPNVMLVINSAIANDRLNIPHRPDEPYAERHPDFILIATANTYGRGADRMYAGRNQLDEATLDRFRIGMIEMTFDVRVEQALCPVDAIRKPLQAIRTGIEAAGLRRLMSTRFMEQAHTMHVAAGWDINRITARFFEGWTATELEKVATPLAKALSETAV